MQRDRVWAHGNMPNRETRICTKKRAKKRFLWYNAIMDMKELTTRTAEDTVTISRAEYEALQAKNASLQEKLAANQEKLTAKCHELAAALLNNEWLMEQLKLSRKKLSAAERQATIARLEKEMKQASKMLEFEYAAVLRDQIIQLRSEE